MCVEEQRENQHEALRPLNLSRESFVIRRFPDKPFGVFRD